jgi:hypothetical protein
MKKLPWYYPAVLVIAAAIVLALPYILSDRLDNETLIGSESAKNAAIARDMKEGVQEEQILNPYHHLLAALSFFGGIVFISKIVPFSLGIAAVLLSYLILIRYCKDSLQTSLIISMLVLSPIFIYTFTVSNPFSLFVVLLLLSFYLFHQKAVLRYSSFLVIVSMNLFGAIESGLTLLYIALITYRYRKRRRELLILFLLNLVILIIVNLYSSFNYQRVDLLGYLVESLTIFGGFLSFGIFFLFLSVYGIIVSWEKQYANFPYVISVILLIVLSVFLYRDLKIILNLVFSALAGIGLYSLIRMKWSLVLVKKLTIFVIALGLLFSALSTVSGLSEYAPESEMKVALWTLRAMENQGSVLTHYQYGEWVGYYAESKPFTTEDSYNSVSGHEGWNISLRIFSSDSLEEIEKMLSDNNIGYILITGDMRSILLDEKLDPSFQFIIENSDSFKLLRRRGDVELWLFDPRQDIR